jgi:hypothetical protein
MRDGDRARRRRVQAGAAILGVAAVAIVTVLHVSPRRPAGIELNPRDPPYFTVCFRTPLASDPPADITSAVKTSTRDLESDLRSVAPSAELHASWVRALVTHESGGDPHAISPTDCAGLVAISPVNLQTYVPCCAFDPEDHAEYAYDLCNSEEQSGYRCDVSKDPRFDVGYALEFAIRTLASFQLESGGALGRNPGVVIPVVWNLGSSAVVGFPSSIHDPVDVFSNLNFDLKGGYSWAGNHELANKVVELFDWMIWFSHLDAFWSGHTTPAEPAATACIRYDPDRRIGGNRLWFMNASDVEAAARRMTRLRIKRLAFGRYSEEFVYFTTQAGVP